MSPSPSSLRFPRSQKYNPAWIAENPMGAHPLWLTEALSDRLDLQPGMRILDLGCGAAKSSAAEQGGQSAVCHPQADVI